MLKRKVLRYRVDGATIGSNYMDLEHVRGTMYVGNLYVGYELKLALVIGINDIYYIDGIYELEDKEKVLIAIKKDYVKFSPENYITTILLLDFIFTIQIEFARLAGLQYKLLIVRREEIRQEAKRREEIKAQQMRDKAKELWELELEEAKETINILQSGETTTWGMLKKALNLSNMRIAPATKYCINRMDNRGVIGLKTGSFPQRTRQTTVDSIFNVINNFVNNPDLKQEYETVSK